MDQNNSIFRKEIKFRMENDAWDTSMARRVLDIKTSQDRKVIRIWSFASLATAAMAFIIFMTGIYSSSRNNYLISGTGSIYSYAYIKNDFNLDNDTIAAHVELLINETYPMR